MGKVHGTNKSSQLKSTAALAGPARQTGPKQPDEREYVLPLFRVAGSKGINRLDFLQGTGLLGGRLVTQIGRLIHSLEKEGYVFKHEWRDEDRFITYVLVAEPNEPRRPAPAPRRGWGAQAFRFGRQSRPEPSAPAQIALALQTSTTTSDAAGAAFLRYETGSDELNW